MQKLSSTFVPSPNHVPFSPRLKRSTQLFAQRVLIGLAIFICSTELSLIAAQTSLFQVSNVGPNDLNSTQFSKYALVASNENASEVWIVEMDNFAQQVSDQYLEIEVPGNDTVRLFRAKHVWSEPSGKMDWYGEMQPPANTHWGNGYASFSQINGEIIGYFNIEESDYALHPLGDDLYLLTQLEDGEVEPVCGYVRPDSDVEFEAHETPAAQERDCNAVVRVLVLHTANAQNNPFFPVPIENIRQALIGQANQALLNSHVWNNELVFVLAGGGLLPGFTESSDILGDLNLLMVDPTANSLRNSLNADCVVLLTAGDYSNILGIAPSCGPTSPGSFCVVQIGAAMSRMTFTHELAHLFGCKHSPGNQNGSCEPDFERPHWFNCSGEKFTIMEAGVKKKQRIPHFSNPEVLYHNEEPTGTHTTSGPGAVERDNARQLREQACLVASFRSSNDFNVHIDGDNQICVYETDSPYEYFADASGGNPGSYAYLWETSNDGINYVSPSNNSASSLILDVSNLQGGDRIFIRVTVTDASGTTKYAYMMVEILPNDHYVCSERSRNMFNPTSQGSLFSLMPNPADKEVTARINPSEEGSASLQVLNACGAVLHQAIGRKNQREFTIRTEDLPQGIYWIKLHSRGITDVQKLVITH